MEKDLLLSEEKRDIEILEFIAAGNRYGIDITDVKEILPVECHLTKIPNSHPYIEGIIMPRDFLIPIVDIAKSLKLTTNNKSEHMMIIVSSIKNLNIAFQVDDVLGMHRTNTEKVTKPGKKLSTAVKEVVTGVLNVESRKLEIIEFRSIIAAINPNINLG
ncbi:MAG TPA: chemotaxis protein CheW [Mobilitalea sp.]|nr:chemotaxis protein CheW [Mobilitalea sp.]